jgi:GT2 family glycosyltransferase
VVQTSNPSHLVSVVVPLYNAQQYIAQALRSILQETTVPLEIIVVNDGSTDNSVAKVQEIQDSRLKLVANQGYGIADALNTGLALAQGEFFVRCDADDLYPNNRIAHQVQWLRQHAEFGAICGGYAAIDSRGKLLVQFDEAAIAQEITAELNAGFTRTHFCTYTVRTEILRALNGFRPYFVTGEDIDLQLRLGEVCRVWYESGMYYFYRLHQTSITHTKSSQEREFFDSIARQFQLQRQNGGQDDLQCGVPPLPPRSASSSALTAAEHIQNFLMWRAWCEHQAGKKWQALQTGLRSALVFPYSSVTWKSLVALAIKPTKSQIKESTTVALASVDLVQQPQSVLPQSVLRR